MSFLIFALLAGVRQYKATGGSPSPVAIIVVSVCVVSHALRVNTNKRTFNTCVCLHPTGLRGNSMILHTFVNLGWRISSMQSAQWRISSKHPFHEQQFDYHDEHEG